MTYTYRVFSSETERHSGTIRAANPVGVSGSQKIVQDSTVRRIAISQVRVCGVTVDVQQAVANEGMVPPTLGS